jgi:hypothetical protein
MVADKTLEGIDQSLSIITAILRLVEIETSQRSAGFGKSRLRISYAKWATCTSRSRKTLHCSSYPRAARTNRIW